MTTYYGVWSGKEWYHIGDKFFYTAVLGIAKAQAMTANRIWGEFSEGCWEACAIGENGLPTATEDADPDRHRGPELVVKVTGWTDKDGFAPWEEGYLPDIEKGEP